MVKPLVNHREVLDNNAVLLISCEDQKGITAKVTNFIYHHEGNIVHADQHIDDQSKTFFMRVEWELDGFSLDKKEILDIFQSIADEYNMKWKLYINAEPIRVAVFVSKHLHCLLDLLLRQMAGHFLCEIPLIFSNHAFACAIAEEFDIEFHEMSIDAENKHEQEIKQIEILKDNGVDLIVLARYHQILTARFVEEFRDKIINIHHSFLPAFVGANPYTQAHNKGVKIIGATSHFVTLDLDQGPIIAQETMGVTHRDTLEDMVRKGEDLEKMVLSKAVRLALEKKILRYGNKTVVFE